MKQASLIFSTHNGFDLFSTLIKFGLRTPYSHVAIKMTDSDTGQAMIWQASGLCVNCVSEAEFLAAETIVYQKDVQMSDAAYLAGKTWANAQLGKPYNTLAILGFALQIIAGMIGLQISNPFKANGSQYVCSQLGAAFTDVCDNINLDITNMTPLSFYNAVQQLPNVWT